MTHPRRDGERYRYYIDFASRNGIPYIILDEGWYNPKSGDMLTTISEIDLPALVAYGKQKGVHIIFWAVFNVLDTQLEAACRKYAAMGIKGFKVDFLDRDDQTAVEMGKYIVTARRNAETKKQKCLCEGKKLSPRWNNTAGKASSLET